MKISTFSCTNGIICISIYTYVFFVRTQRNEYIMREKQTIGAYRTSLCQFFVSFRRFSINEALHDLLLLHNYYAMLIS